MIARPDGRRFLSFREIDASRYDDHIAAAMAASNDALHVHVAVSDEPLVTACTNAGFVIEFTTKDYLVPFDAPILRPRVSAVPRGYEFVGADEVDPEALCVLDAALRQDVPGTDGWVADQASFDAELASPDFDPTGYIVGRSSSTGDLHGLVRFWNQHPLPRLGLLAVLPAQRSGHLAAALLQAGLKGAATWGSATFMTGTARPALQRRLERAGAECTGTFAHMVRPGEQRPAVG